MVTRWGLLGLDWRLLLVGSNMEVMMIVAAIEKHIYKHEETTLTKVTIGSKRMKVFKEADKNERFEMRHVWGFVVSPGTTATG